MNRENIFTSVKRIAIVTGMGIFILLIAAITEADMPVGSPQIDNGEKERHEHNIPLLNNKICLVA